MTHISTKGFNRKAGPFRRGDVCWIRSLQYGNQIGCKSRPVVVIGFTSDGKLICRRCTTNGMNPRDTRAITDTVAAGLDRDTFVINEDITISAERISWIMGHLSKEDEDWVCA